MLGPIYGYHFNGNSNYHALVSRLEKRFSGGFTLVANAGTLSIVDRPDVAGDPYAVSRTLDQDFNTSAFVSHAPYVIGNAGRAILRQRGSFTWDFSANKEFRLHERTRLQFRCVVGGAPDRGRRRAPAVSAPGRTGCIFTQRGCTRWRCTARSARAACGPSQWRRNATTRRSEAGERGKRTSYRSSYNARSA